jgi:ferredoxin--NADP+ reductase
MNKKAKHKVLKIRPLTESTYVLQVERDSFEFIPGQCVNIGLANSGVNREYSTYSAIQDDKKMEFLIKAVENGKVSTALQKLKKGDSVQLDGAYGKFTLRNYQENKQKYVFIASGTGIAPFHSFALSYPSLDYTILHGVRFEKEQYDKTDYKNGKYVACISKLSAKGGQAKTSDIFAGRVTDYLRKNKVDKKAVYYLCGNTEMINEVYDILRENEVNGDQIFTEVFF